MPKKYVVRLTPEERGLLKAPVRRFCMDRPADQCRIKTVENIRQRCVLEGFEHALSSPPTQKLLDGEQEAQIIALRLGPAPTGYANWITRTLLSFGRRSRKFNSNLSMWGSLNE